MFRNNKYFIGLVPAKGKEKKRTSLVEFMPRQKSAVVEVMLLDLLQPFERTAYSMKEILIRDHLKEIKSMYYNSDISIICNCLLQQR